MLQTFLASLVLLAPLQVDPAKPVEPPEPAPVLQVGQPAPEIVLAGTDRWLAAEKSPSGGVVRKESSGSGSVGQDELEKRLAAIKGDPSLAALHGSVVVVHRSALADEPRWKALIELVDANRDRGCVLVSLTDDADAQRAAERLKNEGMPSPVGVVAAESTSVFARPEVAVVGRSGELVALSAKLDEVSAAFARALDRPTSLAIERPLAPSLLPALGEYWNGRWWAARDAAEKALAKAEKGATDDERRAAEDARYLAKQIDGQAKELVAEAARARADGAVEALVDLDLVLQRGFKGDVAKTAAEHLKSFVAQSLLAMRILDYRKYLDLVEKRPLLFPRREDGAGKKLAKELESFLKQSSNDATSQQRARGLVKRFRERHGG